MDEEEGMNESHPSRQVTDSKIVDIRGDPARATSREISDMLS